jgi:hypothetical protein
VVTHNSAGVGGREGAGSARCMSPQVVTWHVFHAAHAMFTPAASEGKASNQKWCRRHGVADQAGVVVCRADACGSAPSAFGFFRFFIMATRFLLTVQSSTMPWFNCDSCGDTIKKVRLACRVRACMGLHGVAAAAPSARALSLALSPPHRDPVHRRWCMPIPGRV